MVIVYCMLYRPRDFPRTSMYVYICMSDYLRATPRKVNVNIGVAQDSRRCRAPFNNFISYIHSYLSLINFSITILYSCHHL